MKKMLRCAAVLTAAMVLCFHMASAQIPIVEKIGSDGSAAEKVNPKALTLEFYLSGEFHKSMLTKDNVSLNDALENELELSHVSYNYSLEALSVSPEKELRENEKYTLTLKKEVFDGIEDFTCEFETDYESAAVKSIKMNIAGGVCIANIEFDCKPQTQTNVLAICSVIRGGKIENISIKELSINGETVSAQPFTAEIDGLSEHDTVRCAIWKYSGGMIRVLGNTAREYTEETQ